MNIAPVQARLDRLERRQSRMLRAMGAAVLVLATAALMGQVPPSHQMVPPGTQSLPMKASSFELVDRQGETRAVLRLENGAPVLQFLDATGAAALRLTVKGADGSIEYVDGGELFNLMKPAHRLKPLTTK